MSPTTASPAYSFASGIDMASPLVPPAASPLARGMDSTPIPRSTNPILEGVVFPQDLSGPSPIHWHNAIYDERAYRLGEKNILRVPQQSPWGEVQSATFYAPGVVLVSTPGHGGIHLDAAHQQRMPLALRSEDGWYEEDCDWARVAVTFPQYFTSSDYASARASVRRWGSGEVDVFQGDGPIAVYDRAWVASCLSYFREHADTKVIVGEFSKWDFTDSCRAALEAVRGQLVVAPGGKKVELIGGPSLSDATIQKVIPLRSIVEDHPTIEYYVVCGASIRDRTPVPYEQMPLSPPPFRPLYQHLDDLALNPAIRFYPAPLDLQIERDHIHFQPGADVAREHHLF